MKKTLFSLALLMTGCLAVNAQNKKVEHNIQIGTGLSWNDDDTERTGATFSIGYGLDIRLNDQLSVMPMAEYRMTSESMIRSGWDGVSLNDFGFFDFSLSGRYHFNTRKPIVIGIGPYVSLVQDRDKYYVDYEPNSSLSGQPKLKRVDFGLMPTVSFDLTNHLSLGAKMNIGLTNMSERYSEINLQESRYLKSAEAFLRLRF